MRDFPFLCANCALRGPNIITAIPLPLNVTHVFYFFYQTKLHDGICQKRVTATIATHDLSMVKHPLTYEARRPREMKVRAYNILYIYYVFFKSDLTYYLNVMSTCV